MLTRWTPSVIASTYCTACFRAASSCPSRASQSTQMTSASTWLTQQLGVTGSVRTTWPRWWAAPFDVVVALCYAWVAYGMAGLRFGGAHMAVFGITLVLNYFIACQVVYLCVTVTSSQDQAFGGAILWTSVQILFSSFFIPFQQVYLYGITYLRYLSAAYFSLEALVQNEFSGTTMSCAEGIGSSTRRLMEELYVNASPVYRTGVRQMEGPQPGCLMDPQAVVSYLDYSRRFEVSVGILLGYLGVLHVLTYACLAVVARKEAR